MKTKNTKTITFTKDEIELIQESFSWVLINITGDCVEIDKAIEILEALELKLLNAPYDNEF
jgi:hypothetical protein